MAGPHNVVQVYLGWANSVFNEKGIQIVSLSELHNGRLLFELLTILGASCGYELDRDLQQLDGKASIEAVVEVFRWLGVLGIKLSTAASDVANGSMKALLDVLWEMILHLTIHSPERKPAQRTESIGAKLLMEWCSHMLSDVTLDYRRSLSENLHKDVLHRLINKCCEAASTPTEEQSASFFTAVTEAEARLGVSSMLLRTANDAAAGYGLMVYVALLRRKVELAASGKPLLKIKSSIKDASHCAGSDVSVRQQLKIQQERTQQVLKDLENQLDSFRKLRQDSGIASQSKTSADPWSTTQGTDRSLDSGAQLPDDDTLVASHTTFDTALQDALSIDLSSVVQAVHLGSTSSHSNHSSVSVEDVAGKAAHMKKDAAALHEQEVTQPRRRIDSAALPDGSLRCDPYEPSRNSVCRGLLMLSPGAPSGRSEGSLETARNGPQAQLPSCCLSASQVANGVGHAFLHSVVPNCRENGCGIDSTGSQCDVGQNHNLSINESIAQNIEGPAVDRLGAVHANETKRVFLNSFPVSAQTGFDARGKSDGFEYCDKAPLLTSVGRFSEHEDSTEDTMDAGARIPMCIAGDGHQPQGWPQNLDSPTYADSEDFLLAWLTSSPNDGFPEVLDCGLVDDSLMTALDKIGRRSELVLLQLHDSRQREIELLRRLAERDDLVIRLHGSLLQQAGGAGISDPSHAEEEFEQYRDVVARLHDELARCRFTVVAPLQDENRTLRERLKLQETQHAGTFRMLQEERVAQEKVIMSLQFEVARLSRSCRTCGPLRSAGHREAGARACHRSRSSYSSVSPRASTPACRSADNRAQSAQTEPLSYANGRYDLTVEDAVATCNSVSSHADPQCSLVHPGAEVPACYKKAGRARQSEEVQTHSVSNSCAINQGDTSVSDKSPHKELCSAEVSHLKDNTVESADLRLAASASVSEEATALKAEIGAHRALPDRAGISSQQAVNCWEVISEELASLRRSYSATLEIDDVTILRAAFNLLNKNIAERMTEVPAVCAQPVKVADDSPTPWYDKLLPTVTNGSIDSEGMQSGEPETEQISCLQREVTYLRELVDSLRQRHELAVRSDCPRCADFMDGSIYHAGSPAGGSPSVRNLSPKPTPGSAAAEIERLQLKEQAMNSEFAAKVTIMDNLLKAKIEEAELLQDANLVLASQRDRYEMQHRQSQEECEALRKIIKKYDETREGASCTSAKPASLNDKDAEHERPSTSAETQNGHQEGVISHSSLIQRECVNQDLLLHGCSLTAELDGSEKIGFISCANVVEANQVQRPCAQNLLLQNLVDTPGSVSSQTPESLMNDINVTEAAAEIQHMSPHSLPGSDVNDAIINELAALNMVTADCLSASFSSYNKSGISLEPSELAGHQEVSRGTRHYAAASKGTTGSSAAVNINATSRALNSTGRRQSVPEPVTNRDAAVVARSVYRGWPTAQPQDSRSVATALAAARQSGQSAPARQSLRADAAKSIKMDSAPRGGTGSLQTKTKTKLSVASKRVPVHDAVTASRKEAGSSLQRYNDGGPSPPALFPILLEPTRRSRKH